MEIVIFLVVVIVILMIVLYGILTYKKLQEDKKIITDIKTRKKTYKRVDDTFVKEEDSE
jgi:hypothetical protein